jgi:hypothetical protein
MLSFAFVVAKSSYTAAIPVSNVVLVSSDECPLDGNVPSVPRDHERPRIASKGVEVRNNPLNVRVIANIARSQHHGKPGWMSE